MLVVVYALVVEILGFLLSTFLFLAAFMYLGRYRRHVAIWATSAGVDVLAAAVLFMRIAYVSLPRGDAAVRRRHRFHPHHSRRLRQARA